MPWHFVTFHSIWWICRWIRKNNNSKLSGCTWFMTIQYFDIWIPMPEILDQYWTGVNELPLKLAQVASFLSIKLVTLMQDCEFSFLVAILTLIQWRVQSLQGSNLGSGVCGCLFSLTFNISYLTFPTYEEIINKVNSLRLSDAYMLH